MNFVLGEPPPGEGTRILRIPSISILSRDVSFQETKQNPGKQIRFLKRRMAEKNREKEST